MKNALLALTLIAAMIGTMAFASLASIPRCDSAGSVEAWQGYCSR
jgi:hypothetical protein